MYHLVLLKILTMYMWLLFIKLNKKINLNCYGIRKQET